MEKKNSVEYDLFNKFSIDTLDSLETILDYSNNNSEYNVAVRSILRKKIEECREDFEGINEYDTITRMLNFSLSEIKYNVKNLTMEELLIIKEILESARINLSLEKIAESIIPIIKENEDAIDECLPNSITDMEISKMLTKCNLFELYAIKILASNTFNLDVDTIFIVNNEYIRRQYEDGQDIEFDMVQMEMGINSLINNLSKFNKRELEFLYSLAFGLSMFMSSNYSNEDLNETIILDCLTNLETQINESLEPSNIKTLTRC